MAKPKREPMSNSTAAKGRGRKRTAEADTSKDVAPKRRKATQSKKPAKSTKPRQTTRAAKKKASTKTKKGGNRRTRSTHSISHKGATKTRERKRNHSLSLSPVPVKKAKKSRRASRSASPRIRVKFSSIKRDSQNLAFSNSTHEIKPYHSVSNSNVLSASSSSSNSLSSSSTRSGRSRKKLCKRSTSKIVNEIVHYSERGVPLVIGQGEMGQLGLGEDVSERTKPALVNIDELAIQICAGGLHTTILTESGKVYTFGCNDEGALGRSTEEGEEFEPGLVALPDKIVQISAGDSHTAALTENGRVYAWGEFRDSSGSMGLTSKGPQKVPMIIFSEYPIAKIVSGSNHLVCLSEDGIIYTCGCAEQGQLGRLADCFTLRGGRKGPDLVLTPSPVRFRKIKNQSILFDDVWAGAYVTFARQVDTGKIYAFGLNNYSQLGLPKGDKPVFTPTIVNKFSNKRWIQMACGQHHSLALTDRGEVYALGRKEYGRLGLGEDCDDANEPTLIKALANKMCVGISCGENVSYAVTDDGTFYGWGMANTNQLGTKDDEDDVWEPLEIKGKQLENRRVLSVSGGGQHTILLAQDKTPLKNGKATKDELSIATTSS